VVMACDCVRAPPLRAGGGRRVCDDGGGRGVVGRRLRWVCVCACEVAVVAVAATVAAVRARGHGAW
jgi:hypothetical protein